MAGQLVLRVDEVARKLRISRDTVYDGIHAGQIPHIKIGRRILVPRAAFERMLEEAGQKPRGPEAA